MLNVSKQRNRGLGLGFFVRLLTWYIQLVPLFWLLHFPEVLDGFFCDGKTRLP